MEFNEAEMRGIDLAKLRKERFSSLAHKKMVERHEEKAKLFRDYAKLVEENPVPKPVSVPVQNPAKVRKDKKYQFTDTQLRIAQAVLEQEKKK